MRSLSSIFSFAVNEVLGVDRLAIRLTPPSYKYSCAINIPGAVIVNAGTTTYLPRLEYL